MKHKNVGIHYPTLGMVLCILPLVVGTWGCASGNTSQGAGTDVQPQEYVQFDLVFGHDTRQPDYGYDPGQPDYGYDPGQPDYGYDPGQPDYGYDPGQPDYGYDPGQPDYGYDPGQPDYGYDPGQPDYGYDPGKPDTSGGHLDCKGFYKCLDACPQDGQGHIDPSCYNNCQNSLSPQGKSTNDALTQCLSNNGCYSYTGDAFSKCLNDHCLDQYFHCFSGNQYQTCIALDECMVSCPKDDPSTTNKDENADCRADCFENATYDTNWDWEHLRQCITAGCPPDSSGSIDPACMNQQITDPSKCYNQAEKCLKHGYSTCKQVWDCINNCSANNPTCARNCYDNGTYTAQYLYSDVISCAFDNCKSACSSNDDTTCNSCLNQQINLGGACYSKSNACQYDTASRG